MAIAFNSATTTNGDATSYTFSHTPAGADRILLVHVAYKGSTNPIVSGITFNTTETLTRLTNLIQGSVMVGEVWYLLNPTATTANVVVSTNNTGKTAIGAMTYTGVLSINTSNFASQAAQNTAPLGSITTDYADSVIIDAIAFRGLGTVLTDDANYTRRYTSSSVGNPSNGNANSASLDRSTPTTGAYSSTYSLDSTQAWVTITYELQPTADTAAGRNFGFIL